MILLVCTVVSRQGHLNVERNVSPAYCKSSSGDDVDWFWHGFIYHGGLLWLVHFNPAIVSMYHGFLRRLLVFLCVVGFDVFFIVGIHAPGISAPLSLFMLFGLSLVWIAFFTFLVYQWLSRLICLKKKIKQLIAWIKLLDQSYFFSALRSGIFRT